MLVGVFLNMEVMKIDNLEVHEDDKVRVKDMGNVLEIMFSNSYASKCSIKKLDKHTYVDLESGEVKEFKKMESRACDISSVRKTMGRLRDVINTNVVDVTNCKWVTLTYGENMIDSKKLRYDFENCIKRLRKQFNHFEYIVAMEPQGRGAWHAHMLMIFDNKAPWISNNDMWKCWSPKGFKAKLLDGKGYDYTETKKLDSVDNVGAYLTAYMTDMLVDDVQAILNDSPELLYKLADGSLRGQEIEVDEKGIKVTKMVIKGARLYLYPPQFNLYRCSKGIKKPEIYYDTEKNAQKKVNGATLTFQKSIELTDTSNNFKKVLDYRYYNLKRK